MSTVSKGAVGSVKKPTRGSVPKLGELLAQESAGEKPVAYISRKGVDGAFVLSPGPKYNAATGVQVGWEEGVHLDFRGIGVTGAYFPESNPVHKALVAKVDKLIDEGWPIVHDLGIERLEPDAPRPPFAKWDRTSASAIKVALSVLFEDNHDANVEVVKNAGRYEKANQNREDVLAVLDGLLATEAGQSDAFSVEVSVS